MSIGEPPTSTVCNRPPMRSRASSTTVSTPAAVSALAAVSPAMPAPITITRSTDPADSVRDTWVAAVVAHAFPHPPPPGVRISSTSPARSSSETLAGSRAPFSRFAPAAPASTTGRSVRAVPAAFGHEAECAIGEHAVHPNHPVTPVVVAAAPRTAAQRVPLDPQRILALQRLDGRVQRVRHGHVHRRGPIAGGRGPLTAGQRLVVRELGRAEGDVVHGALPVGVGIDQLPERARDHVHDPAGGLGVAGDHSGRRPRIHQRADRRGHGHRLEGAARGGDVGITQRPHHEVHRRAGDGDRAVDVSGLLVGGTGEVDRDAGRRGSRQSRGWGCRSG